MEAKADSAGCDNNGNNGKSEDSDKNNSSNRSDRGSCRVNGVRDNNRALRSDREKIHHKNRSGAMGKWPCRERNEPRALRPRDNIHDQRGRRARKNLGDNPRVGRPHRNAGAPGYRRKLAMDTKIETTKKPESLNQDQTRVAEIQTIAGNLGAFNIAMLVTVIGIMGALTWGLSWEKAPKRIPAETVAYLMRDPKRSDEATKELVNYTYSVANKSLETDKNKTAIGVVLCGFLAAGLLVNALGLARILRKSREAGRGD